MSWAEYTNFLRANNTCESAGVINAADGSLVAGDNFSISSYMLTMPTEDGESTQVVPVNEANLVLEVFQNGRCSGPTGLRLAGIKFQIVRYDMEEQTLYLKTPYGGACAARTNKTIVFGSYNLDEMINGKNTNQNAGDTNAVVEKLAKVMRNAGW